MNVRRKKVWLDYLEIGYCSFLQMARFKLEKKLKVAFIGETAIDDGEPRGDIFTDK